MSSPLLPGTVYFPGLDGGTLYAEPCQIVEARSLDKVIPALAEIDAAVASGLEAAGFIAYEAGPAFDPALAAHPPGNLPLLWFGLYRARKSHAPQNHEPAGDTPAWRAGLDQHAYRQSIEHIKSEIAAGSTYQVNFTFPLETTLSGDTWAWFLERWRAQPTPYAAAIHTGTIQVLSVSPELFFRLDGRQIIAEPMKGTAPRGRFVEEDDAVRAALLASEKERAENVMIADMVRNDLGRICATGSVQTDLYQLERHPTVWQMTSRVRGCTEASVPEIFRALFPAASVTGAPKIQTTHILRRLERRPRGAYCGAIGWWRPRRKACFSVAIRTATVLPANHSAAYPVGSGITWDAEPEQEYAECLAKAAVLTKPAADFSLIETLRLEQGRFRLLERHLDRLCASAQYFDFMCQRDAIEHALRQHAGHLDEDTARVRLRVDRKGSIEISRAPLPEPTPLRVGWAEAPMDSRDVFLFHKTTRREAYDAARKARPEFDEILFFNERGEVTEGTFTNIVIERNGRKLTPARTCGLLAGVFRAELLARGDIEETILHREDVARADRVWLINSLRGWIETLPGIG